MPFAMPPDRHCRGSSGSSFLPTFTLRVAFPRKTRVDAWQQEVGRSIGHRATHDDTIEFLLLCADQCGDEMLEEFAAQHFARADHPAPPSLLTRPKA